VTGRRRRVSVALMTDHGSTGPAPDDESPTGGDQTTEDQLEADNPVEEDTLKSLDPDAPPA
jgi:hypothetical protein